MQTSGISSGLDTNQLVSDLMSLERIPINNIKISQNILNKKKEIYSDAQSRLVSLKNIASELSKESSFSLYKITYSDQSVVTWTNNSNREQAVYNVTVNSIAASHTIGSDRKDSSTEALNLAEGTIQINGVDIEVDEADSLTTIRDKINSADSINVSATIIDNVLRLKSTSTGAANQITLSDSNNILLDLGFIDGSSNIKNEFSPALDASVTIDGQVITSASNTITDTIDGVTLQLLKTGSTDVSVQKDISSIAAKIKNFVNQYNSAIDFIYGKITEKKVFPVKTESDRYIGLANADPTLSSIRQSLGRLFAETVSGMDEALDSLADIGITRGSFSSSGDNSGMIMGKLTVDDALLNKAITENPDSVKNMFIKNYGAGGLEDAEYGIAVRVESYLNLVTNSTTGLIASRSSGLASEVKMMQDRIESIERRLVTKEDALIKKYAALQRALNTADTQIAWLQMQVGTFSR